MRTCLKPKVKDMVLIKQLDLDLINPDTFHSHSSSSSSCWVCVESSVSFCLSLFKTFTTRKQRYSDGHSDGKWNPRNIPRNFRGNSEETQNWGSSEFPQNIPTEFRGNLSPSEYSEEIPRNNVFLGKNRWIPRKYYSRWRAVGGFYKIPRKFRRTSLFRRNSVGISSVCRQDLIYINKHSSSSSFTPYLHPPSYSIYPWIRLYLVGILP